MTEMKSMTAEYESTQLEQELIKNKTKKILLVCESFAVKLPVYQFLSKLINRLGIEITQFSDFQSNPLYSSVVEGVKLFREKDCDCVIAIGGGSAIDVAKCIKLYEKAKLQQDKIPESYEKNAVPLMVIPTTAGSGSEATRYAVVYLNGEKQSITDNECIPSYVLLDSSVLKGLPLYQKKSALLDALCHSVESFWSINSTAESKEYSKQAIRLILNSMDDYFKEDEASFDNIMSAAHTAGRAINITQTTAAHAMSYKLTAQFKIAHGHAASLCLSELLPYMISHRELCADSRGEEYLKNTFNELAEVFEVQSTDKLAERFKDIIVKAELPSIHCDNESIIKALTAAVNPIRLKNNPVILTSETIEKLYAQILK